MCLSVSTGAGGIHLKKEAVAVIEERIEHDRQAIVDVEAGVARRLARDNFAGRSVAADGADVQRPVGEQPRISVSSDGWPPSIGSRCTNRDRGAASLHAASSRCPSTRIVSVVRIAIACGAAPSVV